MRETAQNVNPTKWYTERHEGHWKKQMDVGIVVERNKGKGYRVRVTQQSRSQFIFHWMSRSAAPNVTSASEMKVSIDKPVLKANRIMSTAFLRFGRSSILNVRA